MAEKYDSDPITLTRFILSQQRKHPEATGDLTIILNGIQTACKCVSAAVRRAGLLNLVGLAGSANATGDSQKKLDVISDDIFVNTLRHTGRIAVMVSEEQEKAILLGDPTSPSAITAGGNSNDSTTSSGTEDNNATTTAAAASSSPSSSTTTTTTPANSSFARYIATFDPLDGSSNIDANITIGSIFGIFLRKPENIGRAPTEDEALRPGAELVCAGYSIYGSSTQLVVAFAEDIRVRKGVNVFTLDPAIGEFILSHAQVMIPAESSKIYSCNEGNSAGYPAYIRKFLEQVKSGAKPYSARYVGSMIADVHRTLLYGGIFLYPTTVSIPAGKIRICYEAGPMSAIIEAAGGRAITGYVTSKDGRPQRILELVPKKIHEKTPVILGCTRDMDLLEALLREEQQQQQQ